MDELIAKLTRLWLDRPDDEAEALAGFRRLYADPFGLNGVATAVTTLAPRARMMHTAFADLSIDVLDTVESPGKLAIVLRTSGRHVGTLTTALASWPRPAARSPAGRSTCSRSTAA